MLKGKTKTFYFEYMLAFLQTYQLFTSLKSSPNQTYMKQLLLFCFFMVKKLQIEGSRVNIWLILTFQILIYLKFKSSSTLITGLTFANHILYWISIKYLRVYEFAKPLRSFHDIGNLTYKNEHTNLELSIFYPAKYQKQK